MPQNAQAENPTSDREAEERGEGGASRAVRSQAELVNEEKPMAYRPTMARRGFATIEPFIVSPVIFAIGICLSFAVRWLFGASHWLTWLRETFLAIPFMIFIGLVPLMALLTKTKRRCSIGE